MKKIGFLNYATVPASFVLLLSVLLIGLPVLKYTGGTVIYPLDDTFIHMELAKNLSQSGNWGINQYEFGSASSSLLYTLLLTVFFKLFGVQTIFPFVINVIAGLALLIAVDHWLRKMNLGFPVRLAALLGLIFFVPLPVMVMTGMEHTLQCLFSFLFVYRFTSWVQQMEDSEGKGKWKLPISLIVYAVILCSVRYESVFIVGMACLLLLLKKKVLACFQLGFLALLPLLIFGIYSMAMGSYFFPNSVLLKTDKFTGLTAYLKNIFFNKLTLVDSISGMPSPKPGISLMAAQQILFVIPVLYFIDKRFSKRNSAARYTLIILLGTVLLHLIFASTGWFYRYEAYLVCLLVPVAFIILHKLVAGLSVKQQLASFSFIMGMVLLVILSFPFVIRSSSALSKTKQACINIYDQQYQMGAFVEKYYKNTPVAMNDIGIVSFNSLAKNVDLWGLGNIEIARKKKDGTITAEFYDSLCRKNNVSIAIVYDSWFSDSLLSKWKKAATWQIANNVICGDDKVSFYALDTAAYPDLKNNLMEFAPLLPVSVKTAYQ